MPVLTDMCVDLEAWCVSPPAKSNAKGVRARTLCTRNRVFLHLISRWMLPSLCHVRYHPTLVLGPVRYHPKRCCTTSGTTKCCYLCPPYLCPYGRAVVRECARMCAYVRVCAAKSKTRRCNPVPFRPGMWLHSWRMPRPNVNVLGQLCSKRERIGAVWYQGRPRVYSQDARREAIRGQDSQCVDPGVCVCACVRVSVCAMSGMQIAYAPSALCHVRYGDSVCCYTCLRAGPAVSGTHIGYATMQIPGRGCHAVPGTEKGYAATRWRFSCMHSAVRSSRPIVRPPYAPTPVCSYTLATCGTDLVDSESGCASRPSVSR
eukprot:245917-Rhodomonas_salina.3